jgi:hypothetical protein
VLCYRSWEAQRTMLAPPTLPCSANDCPCDSRRVAVWSPSKTLCHTLELSKNTNLTRSGRQKHQSDVLGSSKNTNLTRSGRQKTPSLTRSGRRKTPNLTFRVVKNTSRTEAYTSPSRLAVVLMLLGGESWCTAPPSSPGALQRADIAAASKARAAPSGC